MIIMNAGSSYFEHVENYYGSNACEQNSCRNAEMPAELKTENSLKGVCKYIWKNKKWDIYWLLFFIIFTVAYFAGELNK